MKPSKTLTALLLSTALLSGCGENSGTSYVIRVMNLFFPKTPNIAKETTWKEEVQLQDGTRIWVRRTVVGKAHQDMMNGPGRGEYRVSAYRLEVIDSAGLPPPPVWESKWFHIIIDRDKEGTWYVVVTPVNTKGWYDISPKYRYAQFKSKNGRWYQVDIDKNLDARNSNLSPYIRIGKMPESVSLYDKPLSKLWGYDTPQVNSQYKYVNLDLR
ncbi:hypothetical protein [Kingella bonacorsii]|uniref:Lipoprotein n=1 Tax=Kingella bonacorsii TaxID=2796361 RepID=A0ABS1BRF5_9NEIS|nr:hypothetical protein [Kingella bonacorsii]MBK0395841.1 hypothetical protein [Kingella bonacorsii]